MPSYMGLLFVIVVFFLSVVFAKGDVGKTIAAFFMFSGILLVVGAIIMKGFEPRPLKYQRAYQKYQESRQNFNRKSTYLCKELSARQARDLFNRGHTYLDRDNDGFPCE